MWNAHPNVYNRLLVYPGWQVRSVKLLSVMREPAYILFYIKTLVEPAAPAPAEPEPALVSVAKYVLNGGISPFFHTYNWPIKVLSFNRHGSHDYKIVSFVKIGSLFVKYSHLKVKKYRVFRHRISL